MHYLDTLITEINKTHPHLGELSAMCMLSIKAKKLLMVVSPRGCGKSRATSFIGSSLEGYSFQDRISAAGLGGLVDVLSDFNSVVIVDDIAKTQTPYARITTITTLGELVYSHSVNSAMLGNKYDIKNFNGAAIINVQPVLLKELVKSDEWEASIQDKSIRYYHLYRPLVPNSEKPAVSIEWGINIDTVEKHTIKGVLGARLIELGLAQWGFSRVGEHLSDFLRGAAAIDNRTKVDQTDYRLLLRVLKPMGLEGLVSSKTSFESDRNLDSNMLAILTEYYTYGKFSIEQLSQDYKLSVSQCYRIMAEYAYYWIQVGKSPCIYAPSIEMQKTLDKLGLARLS